MRGNDDSERRLENGGDGDGNSVGTSLMKGVSKRLGLTTLNLAFNGIGSEYDERHGVLRHSGHQRPVQTMSPDSVALVVLILHVKSIKTKSLRHKDITTSHPTSMSGADRQRRLNAVMMKIRGLYSLIPGMEHLNISFNGGIPGNLVLKKVRKPLNMQWQTRYHGTLHVLRIN